jgi:hypothetical protein
MDTMIGPGDTRSSWYWALVHTRDSVKSLLLRHKWKIVALCALTLGAILFFREEWQPHALVLRLYSVPITVSIAIMVASVVVTKNMKWWKRILGVLVAGAFVSLSVLMYEYISLFVRYQSFNVEVIERLPETDNERILPLSSVHSIAKGVMGDSRSPSPPDFVWRKNKTTGAIEYRWTLGVEPKLWMDKVTGSIEEIIDVSGTDASPSFGPTSRTPVRFSVGENLWLSSNSATAAIRSLDPLKFFNYEPTDVRYLEDANGVMVEVISLMRWKGILFPYPEFGGVLVIKQSEHASIQEFFHRVFFGAGEWIPPEEIKNHSYLRGQNILPYKVSRYIAESLRFMNGFLAPLPAWHQGDVRIPDMKENINQQPYTTFFKATNGMPGMLYHYFSLEPYLAGNNGLVASVLIPADGTSRVLVYKHEERNEGLMGASVVPSHIRDSKKNYNWQVAAPAEERPFIRVIDGKTRLLWMTTIVTYKNADHKEFIAGSMPEIALVDSATREVFWVDPKNPNEWTKTILDQKVSKQ